MKTHTKISYKFLIVSVVALIGIVSLKFTHAAETSVGSVNNWFNLSSATRLSVDMTPNYGEQGYHFYSLSPFFQGQNYGLYSGIQTNGNLGSGGDVGNIFIFSVWNATVAYPASGATATPFGGEGVGFSLREQYNWEVGRTYRVTIQRTVFDNQNNGWRWSASITDLQTSATLNLGEIVAPAAASLLSGGSAFHERFSGTTPSCNGSSSNLEKASVTFSNLASDKSVGFSGTPAPNGIFQSASCGAFMHTLIRDNKAFTGFGITEAEFNGFIPPSATPPPSAPATTPTKSTSKPPATTPAPVQTPSPSTTTPEVTIPTATKGALTSMQASDVKTVATAPQKKSYTLVFIIVGTSLVVISFASGFLIWKINKNNKMSLAMSQPMNYMPPGGYQYQAQQPVVYIDPRLEPGKTYHPNQE